MNKKKSGYTEDFRRETVRLLESSGKSVPELAEELGVHPKSLYRWRAKYGTQHHPPANASYRQNSELEAELKRLRRENVVLRQEREILKKAISIFSRSQP